MVSTDNKEKILRLLEDYFNIPLITNYNDRFTFLGEELDTVKSGIFDVQMLGKLFLI